MHLFRAKIQIIGVNPYVSVPEDISQQIFTSAGRDKGPIPVSGQINGQTYTQTLVRYAGAWRLYINTTMLKDSPKHIGEEVAISVAYDPADRRISMHPQLHAVLETDAAARSAYDKLTPSHQQEINRYLSRLKSEDKVQENIARAINYLHGDRSGRWLGR